MDYREFRKTFSPAKLALIRELKKKPSENNGELARRLNRCERDVREDLSFLKEKGIIEVEKTNRGNKAFLLWDDIIVGLV